MFRLCVVLFAVMCAEAGVTVGKAFFCRDPDTGKLHPANTTWPSTTFCGNYHCRLRRKNLTSNEYPPIRQINITNVNILNEVSKIAQYGKDDKKLNLKKDVIDVIGINNLMKLDISNITRDEAVSEGAPKAAEDDRYLTEKEIATISEILHTVKKSDLDAIIEIYNLAQDIYREVDQTSPESLIHETVNDIRQDLAEAKKSKLLKSDDEDQISYWYEPIGNGKLRTEHNEKSDMDTLFSNLIKLTTSKPNAATTENTARTVNSYFGKTLTSKDFGKLPYYYPISNFQRIASYVHQPQKAKEPNVASYTPESSRILNDATKYRKDIKPSIYLPYPFSFIPRYYNWSYPHTIFYNKNYLDNEESKKDKLKLPVKNAVLINPDLENHQELFKAVDIKVETEKDDRRIRLTPAKNTVEKFKPEWQTDPISKHVLEEARAHIEKPKFIKPFSLRKKVKLDRVGKVFKMDEINVRRKRNIDELEPELYEVYIERTTCTADYTVPGFFRYGNISQPFPDCCPQRIL